MKKFISCFLACVVIMSCATTAFAADVNTSSNEQHDATAIVVDMNNIDVTKPCEITKEFKMIVERL